MLLTRWHPFESSWFRQMNNLHDEMNRLFGRWGDWNASASNVAAFPPLNVWEDADQFVVEAELPGLDMNGLEILVTGQNELAIKGERRDGASDKAVQHRQERHFGKFERTLTLPTPVDQAKVEALFENGILTIRLPKHEAAKPRKILVRA